MLLDRPDVGEKVRAELRAAMEQEDVDQVQQMVRRNPELVDVKDNNGRTPLHFATWEENADFARFLLDHHADVNARNKWGRTPLSTAIYEEILVPDRVPTVTLLLEQGADVHAKDELGYTPLHMGAFGEAEIAALLIKHGADVNAVDNAGETPLHKAVQYPEYKVVQELLRHGALKTLRNNQGLTPVQIAEKRGWANLVELLHSASG